MTRGLSRSMLVASVIALVAAHVNAARSGESLASSPVLERFLALGDPSPQSYRALRHLEARNE